MCGIGEVVTAKAVKNYSFIREVLCLFSRGSNTNS